MDDSILTARDQACPGLRRGALVIGCAQHCLGAPRYLKPDMLIRAIDGVHDGLLDLEEPSERDLSRPRHWYESLAQQARRDRKHGLLDTGTPDGELQRE